MNRHAPPPQVEGLTLARLALAAVAEALPGEDGAQEGLLDVAGPLAGLKAAPAAADEPLVTLATALGFHDAELLALALLVEVETDPDTCRMLALCQAPVGGARPLIGLMARAFAALGDVDALVLALACGQGVRSGCFAVAGEDAPLPERALALSRPVLAALRGVDDPPPGVALHEGAGGALPPATLAGLDARLRESGGRLALAGPFAECLLAARAVAGAQGLRVALIEPGAAPPDAAWLAAVGAAPVWRAGPATSDRTLQPRPRPHAPLSLHLVDADGPVEDAAGMVPVHRLTPPAPDTRADLWRRGGFGPSHAVALGDAFRCGPAAIMAVSRALSEAMGSAAPEQAVAAASAVLARDLDPDLDGLARRVAGEVSDAAFVAAPALEAELTGLLRHCRLRDRLACAVGPAIAERYRPGVRALFHGPPGAGKSLAAQWLASRLGLPLYRVDLAAVTSKWIGETEKNLARLLDRGETGGGVLLFDEADTLFGARTEVASSNDRFANGQTNYLLQRLEEHEGIVILTSNARDRLDAAFSRRLDAVLGFPLPDAAARRRIFEAHLGAHALASEELGRIAALVQLAGGHIRNIVLRATAQALWRGEPVGSVDLVAATMAEYAKLGRAPPPELGPP